MQRTLLDDWYVPAAPAVPGLTYLPDWIDEAAERALLARIDAMPWQGEWERRIQVYGASYGGRDVVREGVPPLPDWLRALADRQRADGWFERPVENAVVNEYLPGQGIAAHRDYAPFGPTVTSLSLGSWCVMELRRVDGEERVELPLAPRSLVVLAGAARSAWTHAIPRRQADRIQDVRVPRGRRVSVTFRTVAADAAAGG